MHVQLQAPNPKGFMPPPMPVTQDEDEDPTIHRSRHVLNLPSIQLQSLRNTASIYQDTVYSVLGIAFLANVPHTVPISL